MNYMIFLTYVSCPVKRNKEEKENEGKKKEREKELQCFKLNWRSIIDI